MTATTAEQRLDALYRLGDGEGANRPGLSRHEDEAHWLVAGWMSECGLVVDVDEIGNLYGRLLGTRPDLPEIWCGSHLDSVPRGGRYDGALGVIAALEAVSGLEPTLRTIAVVAFRDEEGWRFGDGFLGSRAVSGQLHRGALDRTDRNGVSVGAALAAAGRSLGAGGRWLVPMPAVFIEAHIEQGPSLADLGAALGVVSSIVGVLELSVIFDGREGHAGTTPMELRRDAALCAAAFQVDAARVAREIVGAVVTVGSEIRVEPGATNVIARRASITIDARAPDNSALAELEQGLRAAVDAAATSHRCRGAMTVTMRVDPVVCDAAVVESLQRAAPNAPTLPSGAGHDAQVLAAAGVSVGMLFVRTLNGGISHSPTETIDPADLPLCVEALRRALAEIASSR